MAYFVKEMYSNRARKVDNISVWIIHNWNIHFVSFPKIYSSLRSMLGLRAIVKNMSVNTRKVDYGRSVARCSGDVMATIRVAN